MICADTHVAHTFKLPAAVSSTVLGKSKVVGLELLSFKGNRRYKKLILSFSKTLKEKQEKPT